MNEQRNISWGELAALEDEFERQYNKSGIFMEDEKLDEARFDFVQQYINGNDNPKINF